MKMQLAYLQKSEKFEPPKTIQHSTEYKIYELRKSYEV